MNKTITFYVDKMPKYEGTENSSYCYTHVSTQDAIENKAIEIHTTSLCDLSFDLIDLGYKIFIVKNNIKKEFYPGMDNVHGKDIRPGHNLMKLVVSGFFDEDFTK